MNQYTSQEKQTPNHFTHSRRSDPCEWQPLTTDARGSILNLLQLVTRRGVAQLGSAPEWGSGGRRFKSCRPDQRERERIGDNRSARVLLDPPQVLGLPWARHAASHGSCESARASSDPGGAALRAPHLGNAREPGRENTRLSQGTRARCIPEIDRPAPEPLSQLPRARASLPTTRPSASDTALSARRS